MQMLIWRGDSDNQKPSPGSEAAGSGEGGFGKKCLHCFVKTHRRYSAKRKRRQRRANPADSSAGWSRLPKAVARLLSDGRGRSPGRKRVNRRYRRGNDLFRPAARASYHGPTGPISLKTAYYAVFRALDAPETLPSVTGEGFWMRQPLFLIPNPYSLIPKRQLDKSELT